jgi:hypothetical protein
VGEIDHAHHPEDHRQAERHQAVDEAGQHPADGDIEKNVEGQGSILTVSRSGRATGRSAAAHAAAHARLS